MYSTVCHNEVGQSQMSIDWLWRACSNMDWLWGTWSNMDWLWGTWSNMDWLWGTRCKNPMLLVAPQLHPTIHISLFKMAIANISNGESDVIWSKQCLPNLQTRRWEPNWQFKNFEYILCTFVKHSQIHSIFERDLDQAWGYLFSPMCASWVSSQPQRGFFGRLISSAIIVFWSPIGSSIHVCGIVTAAGLALRLRSQWILLVL